MENSAQPTTLEDIILTELATGPKYLSEIVTKCRTYAHSSVATSMSKLKAAGRIAANKSDDGSSRLIYCLPDHKVSSSQTKPSPRPTYSVPTSQKQSPLPAMITKQPIAASTTAMLRPGSQIVIPGIGAALMTTNGLYSFKTGELLDVDSIDLLSVQQIQALQAVVSMTVQLT